MDSTKRGGVLDVTDLRPVFLFSLPRSGSTLLQRMLGTHSQISTVSEPWILLPYLHSLRQSGTYSEYWHRNMVGAIDDLCDALPNGREDYLHEIRELALRLYAKAAQPGVPYFLDKTPRYNLIVDDVMNLFPDGRFVVLWRNPLAVVASVLETFSGGRWMTHLHKVDLFEGLERLLDAYARRSGEFASVRYEDLVSEPAAEAGRVVAHLGLDWETGVIDDFAQGRLQGRVGDQTGIRQYVQVSQVPLDKWKRTLASPVRKLWCRRYLSWIGGERLALMGYDLDLLRAELDEVPTQLSSLAPDVSQTARGVVWSVAEPRILRDKLARLPSWHRIYSHY